MLEVLSLVFGDPSLAELPIEIFEEIEPELRIEP
jgi:hypothetical protein